MIICLSKYYELSLWEPPLNWLETKKAEITNYFVFLFGMYVKYP